MSLPELAAAAGIASTLAGACWWALRHHSHPELARRDEVRGLRELMASHHESTLRELEIIREMVSRGGRR